MGISNRDNVIDSRDVIKRIKELEGERESALEQSAYDPCEDCGQAMTLQEEDADGRVFQLTCGQHFREHPIFSNADDQELAALLALQEEAEGYAEDWQYGAQLIRDSYFEDYAQEFAEEIGAVDRNARWPNDCIDWEKAAEELQMDYTSVEFDGVTYWVR